MFQKYFLKHDCSDAKRHETWTTLSPKINGAVLFPTPCLSIFAFPSHFVFCKAPTNYCLKMEPFDLIKTLSSQQKNALSN